VKRRICKIGNVIFWQPKRGQEDAEIEALTLAAAKALAAAERLIERRKARDVPTPGGVVWISARPASCRAETDQKSNNED
jgi:hypothetical protein